MAVPSFAMMPALAKRMLLRAHQDFLPPGHKLRVLAHALNQAGDARFESRPPDIAACQLVDAYIRAYAAWHVYTGEN